MEKIIKKIKVNTTIELLTGLHIGGSSENVEIGGIDNPVIKIATKEGQPYIPGSSLKGKMRCILEQINGINEVGGGMKKKDAEKTPVCREINNLFGFGNDDRPSKIIVRDAYLTSESVEMFKNCLSMDMPFTESKFENTIDRVKGVAANPRQTERVPAGAVFAVEFILNIWDDDDENKMRTMLKTAMNALENDYLGGNGSRGYGQIRFGEIKAQELSEANNWTIEK